MSLKDLTKGRDVDLDRIWRSRAALFPRGLTDDRGEALEGLLSVFALACARALVGLGVDRDLLEIAATEVGDVFVDLESRGLDRLPLTDAARRRFEQRFVLPPADKSPPVELVELSAFARDMIAACRSYGDLRVLARLFEVVARKMAVLATATAVGDFEPTAAEGGTP